MNADQRGSCCVTLSLFRTVNPSELVQMPVAARKAGWGPMRLGEQTQLQCLYQHAHPSKNSAPPLERSRLLEIQKTAYDSTHIQYLE